MWLRKLKAPKHPPLHTRIYKAFSMNFWTILLILSAFSCTLVTGFLLTFAIVVMPGLSKLNDKEFVRAFQVTDGMIQSNQPLFILIWLGSIISVLGVIICAIVSVGLSDTWIIIVVGTIYLLGVQGITISIHLPLNKRIQKLEIDNISPQMLGEERDSFEAKWNFFNKIRAVISFFVSLSLLINLSM